MWNALDFIARHLRAIVTGVACGALGMIAAVLIGGKSFTAKAVFIPELRRSPSSALSGVAAQFGVTLAGADGALPLGYYGDLVRSRGVLERVVNDSLDLGTGGGRLPRQSLADLLHIKGASQELRKERAIVVLHDLIQVVPATRSGTVTVLATTYSPQLSSRITENILHAVNDFSLESSQSQASAERRFVEARVSTARADLRLGEDSLQGFLEKNREYRSAPALSFKYDRLNRRVSFLQSLLTSLAQAYEQARIDEVRNVPQIAIVERPVPPINGDRRYLIIKTLLGALVGGMLTAFMIITMPVVRSTFNRGPFAQ